PAAGTTSPPAPPPARWPRPDPPTPRPLRPDHPVPLVESTGTTTPTTPAARVRVTVWRENGDEQRDERVRTLYPKGMHAAIRDGIAANLGENVTTRIALLDEPEDRKSVV